MNAKAQSGNVFWIILIAVGLLAAITVVISRGGSHVDQSADIEQNRVKMSQIMRYAKALEAGVQQLLLQRCSENEISFENITNTNYTNPNSPADESCHMFQPEGAGLEWRNFGGSDLNGAGGGDSGFHGDIIIEGLEDDTRSELMFMVRISQGLCMQINDELNVSTTVSNITTGLDLWDEFFLGTFTTGNQWGPVGLDAIALEGEYAGCVIDDNGHYVYYHALHAR